MLKLKLQYFGHLMQRTDSFEKTLMLGKIETHVHTVGDAIQQSHPLLSPSPPAFSLSQHQGLGHNVGYSVTNLEITSAQSEILYSE